MSQGGTSIGYVIFGLMIGGFGAGIFANTVGPEVPGDIRLLVSLASPIIGIGVGYLLAFSIKRSGREEERRRYEQRMKQRPPAPPTQIVGKKCSQCDKAIFFDSGGAFCSSCFTPLCNDCMGPDSNCPNCVE